jgi:transposase InsO family protein
VKALKSSHAKIGIGKLCVLFGKTRHAFYDKLWFSEQREEANVIALEMVAEIRREIPQIGTRKLFHMIRTPLQAHGIKMGRDILHSLLLEHGLTIKRKKRYVKTTDSNHWMKKYSNLIKELQVIEAEQVWVADITYIQVNRNFNFLSLITDVYSKQIMGYCLYPTLEAQGTLAALRMALGNRQKRIKLFHHSDRGTQYCCAEYVELLRANDIDISMTENGDPYENPVAERINGILKSDFNLSQEFESSDQALCLIERSIKSYNELRPHMSCNYFTPAEAHKMTGVLEKKWKPKKYFKHTETTSQ